MKKILIASFILLSIISSAQDNQSQFFDNQKYIYFRNANGENDGVRIGRQSGNGLRLKYKSNSFIMDALSNHPVLIRNSADETKFQFHPAGDSYFNGGNFGIGLTSPSSKLHIKSDDANDFLILDRRGRSEVDNLIYLTPSWDNDQNDQLRFNIGTNTIATFEETGNVGIGLVNPTSKLHVFKNGGALDMNLQTNSNDAVRLYFTGASQQWSVRKLNNNDFTIVDETSGSKTPFRIEPGAGNNTFRIESNGNIGVGVVDPSEKLSINGNLLFENGNSDLIFGDNSSHIRENGNSIEFISHASLKFYIDEIQNSSADKFQIFGNVPEGTTSGALFTVVEDGKVGIGTTDFTGNHKLRVEGSIGAREIKVEATGWSDFVFSNDYQLPSLEEVEQYISQNNHLPEIPSEAEVLEDGINLGEMNAKLLQKIEELTLYLIDQNKRIETLEEKLAKSE